MTRQRRSSLARSEVRLRFHFFEFVFCDWSAWHAFDEIINENLASTKVFPPLLDASNPTLFQPQPFLFLEITAFSMTRDKG